MAINYIKYFFLFIICVLAQVLIFNQIALFNIAIPLFFIYFIIRLPISLNLCWLFTLSFIIGLIIDIFSDTPGVNALACTLTAALKRPVYYAYVDRDDRTVNLIPSVSSLGMMEYCKFLLSFICVYCLTVFTIEYFSFADIKDIIIMSASSSVLTFIILLATDCLIPSKS